MLHVMAKMLRESRSVNVSRARKAVNVVATG